MRAEIEERRASMLSALQQHSNFYHLFDHLPDVHFFAKDADGRILFANYGLAKMYGYDSEEEFVGCTDFEILPIRLAEKFRRDDVQVMQTQTPLLRIVELFLNPQGIPDWYLTDKIPLVSSAGDSLGVMGTIRRYREASAPDSSVLDLNGAVEYLRANYAADTSVPELARMCGLSTRQFQAKFKENYNTSPSQFLIRLRVMGACELLRDSNESVSKIATQVGFYDQSALARHLKQIMGYSPLQYRKHFA